MSGRAQNNDRRGEAVVDAPAKRVLTIGLDGATFDILQPLMDEGRLPRLAGAMARGTWGKLRSTTPPITPAAWTTFLTGLQPGSHGIIDFERYDYRTNKLELNSTRSLDHVRNIWQILSNKGLRVGSVNVPMTYPPIPVNGFMISGFETPGLQAPFAYPPEVKDAVLQHWRDPTFRKKWKRKTFGGDELFRKNVDYMSKSFHDGAEMTIWLAERHGWDALMVVFKLVDNLQHKTWKYLDPRWSQRNPTRRDIAEGCLDEMDVAVGMLMDYAEKHNATVLMVSDHGHGSLEGKTQPNRLLLDWGYLNLQSGGAQKATRWRGISSRLLGSRGTYKRVGDIATDLAVDFSRTRACVMHAGMAGFLYINLKGRQPTGIVEEADYDALRDELADRFMGEECRATDPQGKSIQLFKAVHKPEALYGCSRKDQPWLPDLILSPTDGLSVIRKIRGRGAVNWLPYRKLEGTHRDDGILIADGPGVAQRASIKAHIVDCAPTILALLGQPIPSNMEGRVISELFATDPRILSEAAEEVKSVDSDDEVFTDEEMQKVSERLADLGYLE